MQTVSVPDEIRGDVDIKGVARFLSQRFTLEALYPSLDPEEKTERLLNLLDQLSALPAQHHYGLDARLATKRALQICLQNLPRENDIQDLVKEMIVLRAAQNALDLSS